MPQRQISNGRVQAEALRALGSSSQYNCWIGTGQREVRGEIAVMLPDPEGCKTETVRLHYLIKELRVKRRERARTIFIIIQYREETKAHRNVPPATVIPFRANDDSPQRRNPSHISP